MPYRLKAGESPAEGVRRVADEQLEQALASLRDEPDRGEAVHDLRKRLKKLRALLRLVRDETGEDFYGRENRRFRDAGRALSALRDAEVLVETLDGLRARFDAVLYARSFEAVRRELVRRHAKAAGRLVGDGERAGEVAATLEAARGSLPGWPIESRGWSAFGGGLEKVYGRGRKALESAYESGAAADFHDWRKRVKYLWYHLRLLRDAWPGPLAAAAEEAKRLADLLGEDHDLAVLDQTLRAEPGAFGRPAGQEALLGLIAGRSRELRAEAEPLGRRLYAEKPARFAARLGRYWKLSRAEGAAPSQAAGK